MAAGVDAGSGRRRWSKAVAMVPVEIVAGAERRRRRAERSGIIEIEFGSGARVCIRGEVAPETLRQVIELLR